MVPIDQRGHSRSGIGLAAVALVAALAMALATGCATSGSAEPSPERDRASLTEPLPFDWPPQLGEAYPDLQLKDAAGRDVSLSSFKGKVILIEPVGMDCPACQAFAGANRERTGPLGAVRPQQGLQSIEEYVEQYGGGVTLDDPDLVFVQLLLYDLARKGAPSEEEGRRWATHFDMSDRPNRVVLLGDARMIGPASYAMIPGFQLIDRDFVLRVDSAGHSPRHSLWKDLLPELGRLLREEDGTG